jgi:hypothetical protein
MSVWFSQKSDLTEKNMKLAFVCVCVCVNQASLNHVTPVVWCAQEQ